MRALTVWQPHASLMLAGFKPFEFRAWSFADRPALRSLIGQRIVIHAAARPLDPYWPSRLAGSRPCAELRFTCAGGDPAAAAEWLRNRLDSLPLGAGIGTVILGPPVPPAGGQHWRWPVSDPRPFQRPIPVRGQQGFWMWPSIEEADHV